LSLSLLLISPGLWPPFSYPPLPVWTPAFGFHPLFLVLRTFGFPTTTSPRIARRAGLFHYRFFSRSCFVLFNQLSPREVPALLLLQLHLFFRNGPLNWSFLNPPPLFSKYSPCFFFSTLLISFPSSTGLRVVHPLVLVPRADLTFVTHS